MNAPAFPPCDRCTFRHGPGPCIVVRVLPPGVDGAALGAESERAKAARRTGRISSARQHERAVTRRETREMREARQKRASRRSAASRYGIERAVRREGR